MLSAQQAAAAGDGAGMLWFHMMSLAFFSGLVLGKNQITYMKQYCGTEHIRAIKWSVTREIPGFRDEMKSHQHFVSAEGVRRLILKNFEAGRFFKGRVPALSRNDALAQFDNFVTVMTARMVAEGPDPFAQVFGPGIAAGGVAQEAPAPMAVPALPHEAANAQALAAPAGDPPPVQRGRGRPKRTHDQLVAANNLRASVKAAEAQYRLARQLLERHNAENDGGMGLDKAVHIKQGKKDALQQAQEAKLTAAEDVRKDKAFLERAVELFPKLWTVLLGQDLAFVSQAGAHIMRIFSGAKVLQPPREWVEDYSKELNHMAKYEFGISPDDGEFHRMCNFAEWKGSKELTNCDAVNTRFKDMLHWHVLGSVAEGYDLTPYLKPAGETPAEAAARPKLVYKITFDTTQTCKQDLFMMGLSPHTFPVSQGLNGSRAPRKATERAKANENFQSANNVLVLCLAHLAESKEVIEFSVPALESEVLRISRDGFKLILGGSEFTFRMDFHIAADMSALWAALEFKNFSCVFCTREDTRSSVAAVCHRREPTFLLGVPSSKIHLCSLHAVLRIVERLLKNQAVVAYNHADIRVRNKKLKNLTQFLEKALHRKKIKIHVIGEKESEPVPIYMMPEDGHFFSSDELCGRNVIGLRPKDRALKMSALTGTQASKIISNKAIYDKIIKLTEGKHCICFRTELQLMHCRAQ